MHRRTSSKVLPAPPGAGPAVAGRGVYGATQYQSQEALMTQSSLSIPLVAPRPAPRPNQQRGFQAAMMQPPAPNDEPPPGYGTSDKLAPSRKGSEMSVSSKYALTPDPSTWGLNLLASVPEPDDYLHNPDPRRDRASDLGASIFTARGIANLGCLSLLALAFIGLFAVYPIVDNLTGQKYNTFGGYNLGGINASGQVPEIPGNFGLIDRDTPESAYTHSSIEDGSEYDLVFSDEFNLDGRSFYPGDDPFWEAVDLHYWGTNNLEWYSPDMVTTSDGYLNITLDKHKWNKLDYKGGMIASWNKFCFTGANVSLPGTSNVYGLWPAVWAMGNLGRAGYGASLDGTWPYTYDSCDVGTLPNQTFPDGTPIEARTSGDKEHDYALSYQPGQRLSACTCPGESHPGPIRPDGTFVGRAAPEIDMFEAQVDQNSLIGHVSQSGQWAPYNYRYKWPQTPENHQFIGNGSQLNTYLGGVYQQSTSGVTITNQDCYTQGAGCFSVYGFEYKPGYDGYISWINDNKPAWKIYGSAMQADPDVKIGPRPVPVEPMYMLINLGISPNFGAIDWEHLVFPTWMLVDWIRVYQPKDNHNIGCDPPDFPTADYINTYIEAYSNPNLTTWVDDYKQPIPKNRLTSTCT
ncbi:glycoside hydrolase family 16 protein [Ceratobasidium sp. AG-Ba]|nr:glycoside hydrolase family 16 protein [Ceratobasidium sp. AG-Ba]